MSTTAPTDDLARRAAGGDRAALDELVTKFRLLLVGFLRRCLRVPEQDIDDVAGDVWVRVLGGLKTRRDGNFLAWLRTIATHVVLDRAKKKKPTFDSEIVGLVAAPPATVVEPDPKLQRCLESLRDASAKYHAAVIAVYYEAQPQDEAAAALNVEPGTFRTQLHKAKAKLRECLEGGNR